MYVCSLLYGGRELTGRWVLSAVFVSALLLFALGVLSLNLVAAQPIPPPPLPSVYIIDGRVEPSTAPILPDGEVYVFVGNVTDFTVEVQRDNIVIDGAGFFIEQTEEAKDIPGWAMIPLGCRPGIQLVNRRNVTVKNLNFIRCMTGVRLVNSSNIVLTKNNFTYNNVAVTFDSSCNNTIIENNVVENYGYEPDHRVVSNSIIFVGSCNYNTITKNNISMNNGGIFISFDSMSGKASCGNKITMNYIASNRNYGIYLECNYNATVVGNTITNNGYGIIGSMGHSTFYHNNFINNTVQVYIITCEDKPNLWDNGGEGNYWSDYNGTDSDGDGIGDTPYIVERKWVWIEPTTGTPVTYGVDTEDRYPLIRPVSTQSPPNENKPITPNSKNSLTPWIAAAIVITAVGGAALLFHFKNQGDSCRKPNNSTIFP